MSEELITEAPAGREFVEGVKHEAGIADVHRHRDLIIRAGALRMTDGAANVVVHAGGLVPLWDIGRLELVR